MRLRQAIFLDRDGTLNKDFGYVHKYEDWQWLPGVVQALQKFKNAGFLLVAVSNQSGIGRGYYSREQLQRLESKIQDELQVAKCPIDAWYYCPHLPEAHCDCRKPKPGMILTAANDLGIDLAASWLIGDKKSDIDAGKKAGCRAGLFINPDYQQDIIETSKAYPDVPRWHDWQAASQHILNASLP